MAEEDAALAHPLAGRHAVVTGGGSGIGAATARELARLGARLTLMGRRRDRLAAEAAAIGEITGMAAEAEPVDVTDPMAVTAAFAAAAGRFGAVDILVNNAGAAASAPFAGTSLDVLNRMLAVNLTGAFLCTQAVLPAMLAAKSGRIVNVASTAGLVGYAYVSAYCAAKHALIGLTRSLAVETAKSGVTVNAVCPGYTDTDLVAHAVDTIAAKTGRSREAALSELAKANPLGRLIAPQEVAAAVGFLCLPGAGAVTGQAIVVGGGEAMP